MLILPKRLERYKKNEKIKKSNFFKSCIKMRKIVTKFDDSEVQTFHQHKTPISIIYIYIYIYILFLIYIYTNIYIYIY